MLHMPLNRRALQESPYLNRFILVDPSDGPRQVVGALGDIEKRVYDQGLRCPLEEPVVDEPPQLRKRLFPSMGGPSNCI